MKDMALHYYFLKTWIFILVFLVHNFVFSQSNIKKKNNTFLGFNYGFGSHDRFPAHSRSYLYSSKFYKLSLNHKLNNNRQFGLAISLEPGYYINKHLSSNPIDNNTNTTPKLTINEYAFNIGLQSNHLVFPKFSMYLLASTGPTFININTDRLKKGLSFSNIFGIGVNYNYKSVIFDFRCSIRHVSNAGLKKPNRGYNSLNFETGLIFPLN